MEGKVNHTVFDRVEQEHLGFAKLKECALSALQMPAMHVKVNFLCFICH